MIWQTAQSPPKNLFRKQAKEYGICILTEGADVKNKNVCISESKFDFERVIG